MNITLHSIRYYITCLAASTTRPCLCQPEEAEGREEAEGDCWREQPSQKEDKPNANHFFISHK